MPRRGSYCHARFHTDDSLCRASRYYGLGTEAFQEIDYRAMFGTVAKWVGQVDKIERIPEYISYAYHVAQSGRPGPVVLAFPEDVLSERAGVEDVQPAKPLITYPGTPDLERLHGLLSAAKRPLLLVGGGGWNATAREQMMAFAERSDLPCAASLRCQDYFDNRHPCYVGDLASA